MRLLTALVVLATLGLAPAGAAPAAASTASASASCDCSDLTATVPSARLRDGRMVLTLRWVLRCTGGTSGRCEGELGVRSVASPTSRLRFHGTRDDQPLPVNCKGLPECRARSRDVEISVPVTRASDSRLAPVGVMRKLLAGRRITVEVERTCAKRDLANSKLRIKFDSDGRFESKPG